jgi:hypothetical protein
MPRVHRSSPLSLLQAVLCGSKVLLRRLAALLLCPRATVLGFQRIDQSLGLLAASFDGCDQRLEAGHEKQRRTSGTPHNLRERRQQGSSERASDHTLLESAAALPAAPLLQTQESERCVSTAHWCAVSHLAGARGSRGAGLRATCFAHLSKALLFFSSPEDGMLAGVSSAAASPPQPGCRTTVDATLQQLHEAVRIYIRTRAAQPRKHSVGGSEHVRLVRCSCNKKVTHSFISPPKRVYSSRRSCASSSLPRYVCSYRSMSSTVTWGRGAKRRR